MIMRTDLENLFDAMVSDLWANRQDGRTEAPQGFFALFVIHESEIPSIRDAFTVPLDLGAIPTGDMLGATIFRQNSDGIITLDRFDTPSEAEDAYNSLLEDYQTWEDV